MRLVETSEITMATTPQLAKNQSLKLTLLSKNVLTVEEAEMYELAFLAGLIMDPNVLKIIMDLLKMNIAPTAIIQMLKSMRGHRRKKAPTPSIDMIVGKGTSGNSSSGSTDSMPSIRSRPSSRADFPPSRSERPSSRGRVAIERVERDT